MTELQRQIFDALMGIAWLEGRGLTESDLAEIAENIATELEAKGE